MEESTITAKGQTTIPREVRRHLGVGPGDRVRYFTHSDGTVVIRSVVPVTVLKGFIEWSGPPVSIEEMNEAIAEGAVEGAGLDRK